MLDNLFKKNLLADDKDNLIIFELNFALSKDIKDFISLCARNPIKCRKRREEICDRVLFLLGYKLFKEFNSCEMYKELSDVGSKRRRNSSVKGVMLLEPTTDFIKDIDLYGSVLLRKYIIKNGYLVSPDLPSTRTVNMFENHAVLGDLPTVIIN